MLPSCTTVFKGEVNTHKYYKDQPHSQLGSSKLWVSIKTAHTAPSPQVKGQIPKCCPFADCGLQRPNRDQPQRPDGQRGYCSWSGPVLRHSGKYRSRFTLNSCCCVAPLKRWKVSMMHRENQQTSEQLSVRHMKCDWADFVLCRGSRRKGGSVLRCSALGWRQGGFGPSSDLTTPWTRLHKPIMTSSSPRGPLGRWCWPCDPITSAFRCASYWLITDMVPDKLTVLCFQLIQSFSTIILHFFLLNASKYLIAILH